MVGYSHTQKEVDGGCEECEHLAEKAQVYQVSISDLFYLIVMSWSQLAVPAVSRQKVSCCSAMNRRVKLNYTHVYNKYLCLFVLSFILFGCFEEKWLNVKEDLQVKSKVRRMKRMSEFNNWA